MKAWIVTDRNYTYGCEIVFADTRGKAISLCLYDDTFGDCDFTELCARRFPKYDQYYEGDDKPDLWEDENHRIRLVRDFGWSCYEGRDSYCDNCPAKKWCIEWKGADDEKGY